MYKVPSGCRPEYSFGRARLGFDAPILRVRGTGVIRAKLGPRLRLLLAVDRRGHSATSTESGQVRSRYWRACQVSYAPAYCRSCCGAVAAWPSASLSSRTRSTYAASCATSSPALLRPWTAPRVSPRRLRNAPISCSWTSSCLCSTAMWRDAADQGAARSCRDPAIPIIAVSSFAMKGDEEKARASGCDLTAPWICSAKSDQLDVGCTAIKLSELLHRRRRGKGARRGHRHLTHAPLSLPLPPQPMRGSARELR